MLQILDVKKAPLVYSGDPGVVIYPGHLHSERRLVPVFLAESGNYRIPDPLEVPSLYWEKFYWSFCIRYILSSRKLLFIITGGAITYKKRRLGIGGLG